MLSNNIVDVLRQKKLLFMLTSSESFSFVNVALRTSYMVLLLADCRTLDHQFSSLLKRTSCAPKVIKQLHLFNQQENLSCSGAEYLILVSSSFKIISLIINNLSPLCLCV